jgi:hypothetical protein
VVKYKNKIVTIIAIEEGANRTKWNVFDTKGIKGKDIATHAQTTRPIASCFDIF